MAVMDPLLNELTTNGVLTEAMVEWARVYQSELGMPMDTALLELDLIDEEGLLCGLESCYKMTVATPRDLMLANPEIAGALPRGFSQSFGLCPLRLSDNELEALVVSPLSEESKEELRNLFHLETRQIIAPSHYVALSMGKVYDQPVEHRTLELESKLARRRGAADIQYALANVLTATTLTSAFLDVLDFATGILEHACLLITRKGMLRAVAANGAKLDSGEPFALPEMDCSFGAAVLYGGYFVGPLRETESDRRFYLSLERNMPRWALVAPVPTAGETKISLYADNGQRGIAARWAAELTLLASRLGHKDSDREAAVEESAESFEEAFQNLVSQPLSASEHLPQTEPEPEGEPEPEEEQPEPDMLTEAELAAVDRLKDAAAEAGTTLEALVDELLKGRGAPPVQAEAATLVGEVKELFEKLATDIPTQMARGMETAFRNLAPRIAAPSQPAAVPGAPRPAANVGLVRKEAGPREVPSYRSKRRKTKRVKL
jgi:hypothetical protein